METNNVSQNKNDKVMKIVSFVCIIIIAIHCLGEIVASIGHSLGSAMQP